MTQIYPGRIANPNLTADGNIVIPLNISSQVRNIFTVQIYGNFGGGTVTAFTNPEGVADAKAGTTNDIAIKDSQNNAISTTAAIFFNFECNSDDVTPVALKIVLTGATNPNVKLRVDCVA